MSTIVIRVNEVDVTPDVIYTTCNFVASVGAFPGEFEFKIKDPTQSYVFETGQRVSLDVDGLRCFSGYLTIFSSEFGFDVVDSVNTDPVLIWHLRGSDINILFQKRLVYDQSNPEAKIDPFHVGMMDLEALEILVADYLDLSDDDLTFDLHEVGVINPDEKGLPFVLGDQWLHTMFNISQLPGAVWGIKPNRTFYYEDDDEESAPFGLSDEPQPGGSRFGYSNLDWTNDGTKLVNDAPAWGAGIGLSKMVFARAQDTDSINEHGRWQLPGLLKGNVWKQTTINKISNSIVYGSPQNLHGGNTDAVFIRCRIKKPGLSPGDKVYIESHVHGKNGVYPVRQMTITTPTPTDALFDLLLTFEIDQPYGYNNWLPAPTIPRIRRRRTFGSDEVACGITDSFNRGDTVGAFGEPADGLGISDSGRAWYGYLMRTVGMRGRAMGTLHEDWPGPLFGTAEGRLPGPWPVPFAGSLVLTDADSFPDFSLESEPSLPNSSGGIFDGGENITGANELYVTSLPAAGGFTGSMGFSSRSQALYDAYEPVTITGHIRANKLVGSAGNQHRGWNELDHFFYFSWAGPGAGGCRAFRWDNPYTRVLWIGPSSHGGGSDADWGDLPQPEEVIIPAIWVEPPPFDSGTGEQSAWAIDGEADFEITYSGGIGGVVEFTLAFPTAGSYTVTRDYTGTDFVPSGDFGMSFSLHAESDDICHAEAWLSNLLINGEEVETGVSWSWTLAGEDTNGYNLGYSFTYNSQGATQEIIHGYDAGETGYGDPAGNQPAMAGPHIIVRITSDEPSELSTDPGFFSNREALAFVQLAGPLAFPSIPFVEIDSFQAMLQMGGETLIAYAADGINSIGDAAPIGLLLTLDSQLTMFIKNHMGTFVEFDDLNITGVNACTEGLIVPAATSAGAGICQTPDHVSGLIYETAYAYMPGTLNVYMGGLLMRPVVSYFEDRPKQIEFFDPPTGDLYVCYLAMATGPNT